MAAGGVVLRDLFMEHGDGWFEDAALLDRLAEAKLAEFGATIATEGWKWIEVSLSLMSSRVYGLRVLPTRSELSEAEQDAFEAALAEREGLDNEYGYSDEEWPADAAHRMSELEKAIAAFEARAQITTRPTSRSAVRSSPSTSTARRRCAAATSGPRTSPGWRRRPRRERTPPPPRPELRRSASRSRPPRAVSQPRLRLRR